MPRKKSAAKKTREEAEKLEDQDQDDNRKRKLHLDENDEHSNEDPTINENYAKRLKHNKDRESLRRQEEKEKRNVLAEDEDLSAESSTSEEEDDFGELVTEDIDKGINEVLTRLKQNPKSLLNPNAKFFVEVGAKGQEEEESSTNGRKKEPEPMYLKDYHRMNLLNGGEVSDDGEEKPYVIIQEINRQKLVEEIHKEGEDSDSDSENDFLKKRAVERTVVPVDLPNPERDADGFLKAFMDTKSWIPKEIDKNTGKPILPTYGEIIEETDDDDEFDDIVEKFETGHNFRFEDPNAAELISYARDQNTLRRNDQNSRKRQREKKKDVTTAKEKKYQQEVSKVKKQKTKEVVNKLATLKEVLGDEDVASLFTEQDLEGDFKESEWDKKMMEIFNEEFYSKKDNKFEVDQQDDISEDGQDEDEAGQPKSKSRQKKEDKLTMKKERKELLQKAEKIVEENLDIALDEANIKRPGEEDTIKFRYREVSPESFGLSARDILTANDKQLNEFIGLKAMAPYRNLEKKQKDKKKYAKKRRLREWRKSIFGEADNEPA